MACTGTKPWTPTQPASPAARTMAMQDSWPLGAPCKYLGMLLLVDEVHDDVGGALCHLEHLALGVPADRY